MTKTDPFTTLPSVTASNAENSSSYTAAGPSKCGISLPDNFKMAPVKSKTNEKKRKSAKPTSSS